MCANGDDNNHPERGHLPVSAFYPFQNVFLNSLTLQVLVALVVGSLLSSTFKYHAKMFIILLMSFLVLVVPIPLFLFKPRWPLNAL